MAEFILLTEYETDRQLLINTDEIVKVEQTVTSDGIAATYLIRKGGYMPVRINESVSQVTMLLSSPIGRHYAPTAMGGYSSGPVPVGSVRFI
jgi:hypothetical protein